MDLIPERQIEWLKYRWHFIGTSLAVLLICGVVLWARGGLRYGIDFSEGTIVYAKFRYEPSLEGIRGVLSSAGIREAVIQRYDREELNQLLIRVGLQDVDRSDLTATAARIVGLLRTLPGNPLVDASTEVVGPVVGTELREKARNATLVALLAMLVYIGFRFEPIYGVGATVAVAHDVLVTLGLLAAFGHEIGLNAIAAFLTLVGYSVNDTIVIFDRVRENRRLLRQRSLYDIINLSINQTLRRTVLTSGLTFLAVLPLFLVGGEALRSFSFVMLVGVVAGTYSTLGIASPIVLWGKRARSRRPSVGARRKEVSRSEPRSYEVP